MKEREIAYSPITTAILVDGGFYRKHFEKGQRHKPEDAADALMRYCGRHLWEHNSRHDLYRIFYYDCLPCNKKIFHPFYDKTIDYSKSEFNSWMNSFLDCLKTKRKVALRLGYLDEGSACFTLTTKATKDLLRKNRSVEDLTADDFKEVIRQKGVDMRIGMDIASLAYKKQVDQIVLIAGDADFVPAAKLARREGIDFVLDPLDRPIKEDLFEHIDGKRSCGNPYKKDKTAEDMEPFKA